MILNLFYFLFIVLTSTEDIKEPYLFSYDEDTYVFNVLNCVYDCDINQQAFANINDPIHMFIKNGIESFDTKLFQNLKVQNLTISSRVQYVNKDSLYLSNLENVFVEDGNEYYHVSNYLLIDSKDHVSYIFPNLINTMHLY